MEPEQLKVLETALSKTKIELLKKPDSAFIATICFSLDHHFCDSMPTACTQGTYVKYNPEFFANLSQEERLFLMLHETWHVVFDHCSAVAEGGRIGSRDHDKFNIACDYVINNMLDHANYSMPKGGYMDHKYDGMSAEQVYDLLPPSMTQPFGGVGDILPTEGDPVEAKEKLDNLIMQAAVTARMQGEDIGKLPGEVQVQLDKLTNPKLPWNRILSKFFTSFSKNEYTFRKPNRRFMPKYIIPSAYSEAVGSIAMAIDMSGSVSNAETTQFISDGYHVIKTVKLKKLEIVQFDTKVFNAKEIKTGKDLLSMDFRGRGSTDIDPPLTWAKKNKPDAFVIFTDGYFGTPRVDPGVPVVWLIHNNKSFKAPFGQIIHYDIKETT